MHSILKSGFWAIALGGLATVSHAQNGWDQPSSLGSYRPVASGNSSWSNQYLGQENEPVPDAQWNTPSSGAVNGMARQSQTTTSPVSNGAGCDPCDQRDFSNGRPGYANGCQTGCDSSGTECGENSSYGFGNFRRKNFVSRLLTSPAECTDRTGTSRNNNSNLVGGVSALVFYRDLEDDRGLSYNGAGQYLFSTDSDLDAMGGFEVSLGRRGCSGNGWEASYWSLNPSRSSATLGSSPYTALGGLSEVYHVPSSASALDIYNNADTHQICRTNDISNLQFNILRNGGNFACGRGNFEMFGGLRWFQFDEDMRYSAYSSYVGHPSQFNYDTRVENTLLGTHFGGRMERCLTGRLRFATSLTLGIFNNNISQSQSMSDEASGTWADINSGPFNGRPYNYSSQKNDLSMLGEMNFGGYWLLSNSVRFSLGYRVLGVSGLALAPDQIPVNFTDGAEIQRIESNGSLILHGAYFGLQKCF